MPNFCTNCGFKLGKEDNFCMNCGARIDRSDERLKLEYERMEKRNAKQRLNSVVGGSIFLTKHFKNSLRDYGLDYETGLAIRHQVESEIESGQVKTGGVVYRVNQLLPEYKAKKDIEREKLRIFDEIIESPEIQSEISKYHTESEIRRLKVDLRNEIKDNDKKMGENEIRDFINGRLNNLNREKRKAIIAEENARIARENARRAREEEIRRKLEAGIGGYCGLSCAYCYEEFLDSSGGIIGDFSPDGLYEYYCRLGHSVSIGSYCEDYK